MRLSTSLFLRVAAAAVLAPVSSAAAVPAALAMPAMPAAPAALSAPAAPAVTDASCAGADEQGFPLTARIHDGPSTYEAGGGFGVWYLDLTNTTPRTCTDVHPVVVLADDKRALKPSQTELEFYDGPSTRPVMLTETDESELVGVFDGNDFPGFTIASGATVSVKVRLAVASDAVTNAVTVNAAAVQRQGSDGQWVGESNDYRFGIGEDPPPPPTGPAPATPATPATQAVPATPAGPATPADPADPADPTAPIDPEASATASAVTRPSPGASRSPGTSPGTGTAPGTLTPTTPTAAPGSALPFVDEAAEAGERARELARTGLGVAHGLLAATVALLTVGGGAFLLARRRR
ncbi:hypothetical protein [Streptomyces sp. NPDC051016]|uniref:hypothetical protein n=1 Tax=Streptomyces sp. NPDC051016 TaxID=3365638 RepID=UPI003799FA42